MSTHPVHEDHLLAVGEDCIALWKIDENDTFASGEADLTVFPSIKDLSSQIIYRGELIQRSQTPMIFDTKLLDSSVLVLATA